MVFCLCVYMHICFEKKVSLSSLCPPQNLVDQVRLVLMSTLSPPHPHSRSAFQWSVSEDFTEGEMVIMPGGLSFPEPGMEEGTDTLTFNS